jgi:hypothetical protein
VVPVLTPISLLRWLLRREKERRSLGQNIRPSSHPFSFCVVSPRHDGLLHKSH